jgi:hypothetical protein
MALEHLRKVFLLEALGFGILNAYLHPAAREADLLLGTPGHSLSGRAS